MKNMGQLIYPNRREIKGPWLLGQEDFEDLERIFLDIDKFLKTSKEIEIQETVYTEHEKENLSEDEIKAHIEKAKNRFSFEKNSKTFMVISENETKLRDSSIRGLLKDKTLRELKPAGFYVYIEYGYNNKIKFEVSNKLSGELNYDLSCYDSKIKDEIQFELDKWIDRRSPSKFLQFWSNWGGVLAIYLFLVAVLISFVAFSVEYQSYNDVLVKQANDIIKQGVSVDNSHKAIDLLLKMQTSYVPDDFIPATKPKSNLSFKILAIIIFLIIIGLIKPKTTIGLGKRKLKLKIYKHWLKIVIAVFSGLIIGPFWNNIIEWFWAK